jgi:excisionase family DNA binding protein
MKLVKAKAAPPTKAEWGRTVTIKEAAEYAGVSRWMMRGWILRGNLPAFRVPTGRGTAVHSKTDLRGYKVDLDDVDRFVQALRENKTLDPT